MKRKKSMEEWLAETQAPRIVESSHRERLKNQLIQEYRKEKPIMIRWMTTHQKTAWTLCLFLITVVATSSWAGYTALRSYIVEVKTVREVNIIDEKTGDATATVQIETVEKISTIAPDSIEKVKTVREVNVIDGKTGDVTSTVQIETDEEISTVAPDSAAALSEVDKKAIE
ncbi:MAG: hypothetical protein AB1656_22190 [Candidatus Omnitrophota bacterium]